MNKRVFESYLKGSKRYVLETSCFKYDNYYLITDSYSIIALNDTNDLKIIDDNIGLTGMYENFRDNFKVAYTFFKKLENNEDNCEPIDDKFGINIKLFNKIRTIIKADSYAVLENEDKNAFMKYVIRLENKKTKEHSYLLPMKRY